MSGQQSVARTLLLATGWLFLLAAFAVLLLGSWFSFGMGGRSAPTSVVALIAAFATIPALAGATALCSALRARPIAILARTASAISALSGLLLLDFARDYRTGPLDPWWDVHPASSGLIALSVAGALLAVSFVRRR